MNTESEWNEFELYVDNIESLEKLRTEFVSFVGQLLGYKDYYYNRYHDNKGFYIKLGLYRIDDDLTKKIVDKAREFGAKPEPSSPDLQLIDGLPITEIKSISTRTAVTTFQTRKWTHTQVFYFIHFLMNQLGYSYNDELSVYRHLIHSIEETRRSH